MIFLTKRVLMLMMATLLTACASTLEKYQTQADAGDVESQFILGNEYYLGSPEIPQNKDLGIKYLTLAADNGNIDALFTLGVIYDKEKQYEKAISYYELAVKANDLRAQDNLAIMYHNGKGVEVDLKKAEELYLAAASNGSQYSERNLGILYQQDKQYKKSIRMFQKISFEPTSKSVSYNFKKLIALDMMEMYQALGDDQQAYVWGATAVLAGVFDANISNGSERLASFNKLSSGIGIDTQALLAKEVLENHYKVFQQYESYFARHPHLKSENGVVDLSTKDSISLVAYMITMNKKTIQKINYLKTKSDKQSKISLAINQLRLAGSYIELGALSSQLYIAQSKLTEAMEILNEFDDSNLSALKLATESKIRVLNQAYRYQIQQLKK